MIIQTKFNIGDKVWFAEGFMYSFEVNCLACNAGEIILLNGSKMPCGICRGTGIHRRHRPYKIRPQNGVIKDIEFRQATIQYTIDTCSYPMEEKELFDSFFEARKKAKEDNKMHGWPKIDFERDVYEHRSRCYWGTRLRKDLNFRNIE